MEFASAIAMLVLILDTRTAISGAQEGVVLCFATVIPTLLPFFVLSALLTASLTGASFRFLRPLERLLRIPSGTGSLFLIGILGGYPTGAQAVADANRSGQLSDSAARRMYGFCSNAGPSFIFGITAAAFAETWAPWLLWGIHIFSAVIVARLLPGSGGIGAVGAPKPLTVPQALDKSLKTMGRVCGWIILFRVVIAFCNRWFLWLLDTPWQIAINGALELTIGCTALGYIENEGLRLILCSAFLSFGGLCVAMQTRSVTTKLGITGYLTGKLLQTCISILLSASAQFFLLPEAERCAVDPMVCIIIGAFVVILTLTAKKGIAFRRILVYNPLIRQKQEVTPCSSESASKNPAPTAASAPSSTTSKSFAPSGAWCPRITSV